MNEENTMSNEELFQDLQKLKPETLIEIKSIIDKYERLRRAAIFSCICFFGSILYMEITRPISMPSYLLLSVIYCVLFYALTFFDFDKITKTKTSK